MPRMHALLAGLVEPAVPVFAGPGDVPAEAWFVADDLDAAFNEGEAVEGANVWLDASGHGHHATGGAGTGPTFRAAVLNGHDAVQFDGSNDFLAVADHAALKLDTDSTVFMVLKANSTSLGALLSKAPAASSAGAYYLQKTTGGKIRLDRPFVEAGADSTNAITHDGSTWHIIACRVNGTGAGGVTHRKDEADNGSDELAVGTPTTDPTWIGRWNTVRGAFHLAELAIYNTPLSDADRNTVEAYLASKYGL